MAENDLQKNSATDLAAQQPQVLEQSNPVPSAEEIAADPIEASAPVADEGDEQDDESFLEEVEDAIEHIGTEIKKFFVGIEGAIFGSKMHSVGDVVALPADEAAMHQSNGIALTAAPDDAEVTHPEIHTDSAGSEQPQGA